MWVAALVLSQLAFGAVASVEGSDELTLATLVASFVGSYLGLAGGAFVVARRRGESPVPASLGLAARARDIPIGVVAGLFASFVLVPVVAYPIQRLFPDLDLSEEAERLVDVAPGWRIWVLAAFVAVMTPIVEEVFFRGFLQRPLVARFGPVAGIAASSLLFALVHFQPAQFLPLAAFGALLGFLAYRTARLAPGIVAHAVFNAVTVAYLSSSG